MSKENATKKTVVSDLVESSFVIIIDDPLTEKQLRPLAIVKTRQ